ncbi:hypothetical protein V8G55_25555, partial [Salmonella enterica subsp. enterica serovar Kentucky]
YSSVRDIAEITSGGELPPQTEKRSADSIKVRAVQSLTRAQPLSPGRMVRRG